MRYYWSCTKFADKIRGIQKPTSLSSKEWDEWNEKAKNEKPFRYWLAETFLDSVQSVLYYPKDIVYNIKCYFVNRYIDKTHCLSSPLLNKGVYYDLDYRIVYCVMDSFVYTMSVEDLEENNQTELLEVYYWWTNTEKENFDYDEAKEMLHKLIDNLHHLWN